jgi:7-carboxy-7-deazaguanine synthase
VNEPITIPQTALTVAEKERRDTLRINEIFFSIQGEGTRAGEPCVFVRLTGCGLRCTYCDTEYAFYEGNDKSLGEVLEQVRSYGCNLVELTGGEPLEQEAASIFMKMLCDDGYDVMVETGGHVSIEHVDTRVKRIVDLKAPSSGMMKRNFYDNIKYLTSHDEVKFVVGSREDYDWMKEQIEFFRIHDKVDTILVSAVHGKLPMRDLAEWILSDKLNVKLQTQLHKLIWPDIERGV